MISAPSRAPAVAPALNPGWKKESAGPILLFAGQDNRPFIVLPGLSDDMLAATPTSALDSLFDIQVDLFDTSGPSMSSARLVINSRQTKYEGCLSWPVGVLAPPPRRPWRIGLASGMATAYELDSLGGMTAGDSVLMTAEIARLASVVAEGADPAFRGLPFAVTRAYRFRIGVNSVILANVVRRINEEANPRVEHLMLVAEESKSDPGRFAVAFESRISGAEDVVRTSEILSIVRFLQGNPAVIMMFEYEEGNRLVMLERVPPGEWKMTWRSAYTGC